MRSPFANPVLLTVALLAGYACSNGGKSTLPNSPDGSVGSGGAVGSGGKPAASGGVAAGGVANTGGVSSTGGIASAGGAVGSGGAAGDGGVMSSGGMATASGGVASGGVMSSGGTSSAAGGVATGGTGTGGAISTGGTAGTGDAGVDVAGTAPGCSCVEGTTSWDCYCMAYASACATNLGAYYSDAGIGSSVVAIQEYANCNLVVITTFDSSYAFLRHVYDRPTGLPVGDQTGSDTPTACPFGAGTFWTLSAGRFPDSTCVRSKCVLVAGKTPPPGVSCGDAGI
jgi:hypothetical protein